MDSFLIKENTMDKMISRMVCKDGFTLSSFCTSTDLRNLFHKSGHKLPNSPNTIRSIVTNFYNTVKADMIIEFERLKKRKQRFSLTFDEWTSQKNHRYLNINVHQNENHFNLGLVRINGSATAEHCITLVKERLTSFGLDLDTDIIAITTDGASVMVKVGRLLRCSQQLCFTHGLQLVVVDALYKKSNSLISEISECAAAAFTTESDDDNDDMDANEQGLTVNINSLPLEMISTTYEDLLKKTKPIAIMFGAGGSGVVPPDMTFLGTAGPYRIWAHMAQGGTVVYPEKNHILCTERRCTYAICSCYILPLFLCIPSYNIFQITTTDITEDGKLYILYHTSLNENVKEDRTLLMINFWLFAVLIKLLPCVILTIISCWLIRTLFNAKRRKQVLRGYDSFPLTANGKEPKRKCKSERRADRTTRMLIAVLLLFLLTEFPQGLFAFVIGIKGKDFFLVCYQQYGEVMDMMALMNGSINFILYCCMNRMFRATFGRLFRPKILDKWIANSSDVHTTYVSRNLSNYEHRL
ncbi:unnamed protein product [Phaedon cochleariae]|uniref:G-protein coupled receptors family 1 profile domain-containing protein n=1 Tax=Phaedon cochleariae TaxID=80249 RepID=A0A9N9SKY0_PHACE|nr:unnamed protein product [Phaedon cochleariae]